MPARTRDLYMHIGPPKTATTYLQDILWYNRDQLARQGVTFPGSRLMDHFHAAVDLRGMLFGRYDNPRTHGAWERLVSEVQKSASPKVLVSHEIFAGAQPDEVARALADLEPLQVHVIYGVRDLARQLPAVWQESLKNRATHPYPAFLRNALRPRRSRRRLFWRSQDPIDVLARWNAHVPAERIHVVTLPPSGTAPGTLWSRFCEAMGIDPTPFDLEVARPNASLSVTDCEVLRRLNRTLPADVEWPKYVRVVKQRFNQRANQGVTGPRLGVPPRYRTAVLQHTERIRTGLKDAGYHVVGDLDDLNPDERAFNTNHRVDADAVADAAVELLVDVLLHPNRRPDRPEAVRGVRRRVEAALRRLRDRFCLD